MDATDQAPLSTYASGWRQRQLARRARCRDRASAARVVAARCARLLVERFGAKRVWLYGSTLDPELFHERSDIDVAAEGIQDWPGALLACDREAVGFDISVMPVEDAALTLRQRIEREGVLLDATRT